MPLVVYRALQPLDTSEGLGHVSVQRRHTIGILFIPGTDFAIKFLFCQETLPYPLLQDMSTRVRS
jgi:hypothetical protein